MKIYVCLGEGSWGFIKHCTSRDIFAFTLKNRLCTEAAILNLDIFLYTCVFDSGAGSTWKKSDNPVHFEKDQFVCFQQNEFVGKLVLPMAKRGGHPN